MDTRVLVPIPFESPITRNTQAYRHAPIPADTGGSITIPTTSKAACMARRVQAERQEPKTAMNYSLGTPAHAMLPVNVKSKQRVANKTPPDEATRNNKNTGPAPGIKQSHKTLYSSFASFLSPRPCSAASNDKDNQSLRPTTDLHPDPAPDPACAGMTGESSSRRHSQANSASSPPSSRSSADRAPGPFASSRRVSRSVAAGTESAPLTAADAVIGLIAASCQAQCDLDRLNTSPTRRTAPLKRLQAEVQSFKTTAQLLHKVLRHVETGTLAHSDRPALVELDVLIAVLAASVLSVSELESRLEGLEMQAGELGVTIDEMVQRHSTSLAKDANRLGMVDFIITQLLSVLQVSSRRDASRHQAQAGLAIMDMLQADAALARRMQQLQDTADGLRLVSQARRAELAARPPPSYSVPSPRGNDELPNYYQALRDDSVAIQPRNWSIYSGLNLVDIPTLSNISLPLILGEMKDAYYYTEEYAQSVRPGLIALEEAQNTHKSKALAQVLGIKDEGSKGKGSPAPDHGGLVHRLALKVAGGNLLGR